jgi:hypothetical protein
MSKEVNLTQLFTDFYDKDEVIPCSFECSNRVPKISVVDVKQSIIAQGGGNNKEEALASKSNSNLIELFNNFYDNNKNGVPNIVISG